MDVARLNFSHGTRAEHRERIEHVRHAAATAGRRVAVLQDLAGPKIRIGKLDRESYDLLKGDKVTLSKNDLVGNNTIFSCSHKEVIADLKKSDIVFINDGTVKLIVREKKSEELILEVLDEGEIRAFKGMNIPSQNLKIEPITKRDIEFIKFGIEMDVDLIAASFIRTGSLK